VRKPPAFEDLHGRRPVVPLLPAHSVMIMMIPMCVVGGDAGLWGTGIENVYRGGELLGAYVL